MPLECVKRDSKQFKMAGLLKLIPGHPCTSLLLITISHSPLIFIQNSYRISVFQKKKLSILCLFQAKIFYFWQSLEHTNIYSIDYEKYSSSVYTQAQICPNRWYVVYLSGIVYICMLLHFFQKRRLKITHVWFWINLKWGRILTDCLGW